MVYNCRLDTINEGKALSTSSLFLFPHKDIFILYAPLHGKVIYLNRSAGELISKYGDNWVDEIKTIKPELYNQLSSEGLFEIKKPEEIFENRTNSIAPTKIILSLTSDCPLRCVYCYARAGEDKRSMPFWISRKAIDFAIRNAINKREKQIKITIHGQGEPTKDFKLLTKVVEYANNRCIKNNLSCKWSMSTNCIHTKAVTDFLMTHGFSISASVDGTEKVQNHNRPFYNGRGSFNAVFKALRRFDEANYDYTIRSTVIPGFENDMSAFVAFVGNNLKAKSVAFEPVEPTGRGLDMDLNYDYFIPAFYEEFKNAQKVGAIYGIKVTYSGCRYDKICYSFCGGFGKNLNFFVTTEGLISSCIEHTDYSQPTDAPFIYGKVSTDPKELFDFDENKIQYLESFGELGYFKRCEHCFSRWNCGGDCLSRSIIMTGDISEIHFNKRCWLNCKLLKDEMELSFLKGLLQDNNAGKEKLMNN